MRDNTPPRVSEIEEDEGEVIHFDNDVPPDDDDELEMEEITLEELEARYGSLGENDSEDSWEMRGPVEDNAALTFKQHKAPVFGCSLHPHRPLAATGGEDDRALIWNTQTGEVVYEIGAHKDTVTDVHFSYDGAYLASADMAGDVQVHKIQEAADGSISAANVRCVWSYQMGDMAWMRWHRAANVLLAGCEGGDIFVWRIPSGDCKILAGAGARCSAGELTGDGKKLFAAYANGIIKLWDLKNCTVLMEVNQDQPMSHQEGITAVACDKESPLYMSGGEDGKIIFCSNNGPVGVVEASGPVECVAFSPSIEMKVAASGTLHGQIAIWDYTRYSQRTVCDHPEIDDGITRMKWISDYTLLVATVQGNIYGYDARTGARKFTLSGHRSDIYEISYDAHECKLLSVSEDHSAKIFNVPQLGD